MSQDSQAGQEELASLWTFEFAALCAISVLAFSNISIFYGFYGHLTQMGIPPAWRGPLLALEPLTAFALRPFLGRYLTMGNGVRFMAVGFSLLALSLVSYPFATTIPVLAVVRVVHGTGFAVTIGGLMGVLMAVLPKERSAQGFGLFSLTILVPYALMPFLVELLLPHVANTAEVYALAAPLMLPALLLVALLRKRVREKTRGMPREHLEQPEWSEVRQSLAQPGVLPLVAANLCFVTAQSIVFFFMRDFAVSLGAGNPGMFFTCANAAVITLRVAGGPLLDRLDKGRVLFWSYLWLAALVPLFVHAALPVVLFGMAVLYGVGMAMSMPLMNSCMLLVSLPRLRVFNANLLMLAVDAGFFAGPFLGGMLMAAGWTHTGLFDVGGALMLAAGLCILPVARQVRRIAQEAPAGAAEAPLRDPL